MKPFVSTKIIFLLFFFFLFGCTDSSSQNINKKTKDKVVIIFVQADYKAANKDESKVFNFVLNYLISDEFKRIFNDDPFLSAIYAFPLNIDTRLSACIARTNNLKEIRSYERSEKIKNFLSDLYFKYKSSVAENQEFQQDIIGSYEVLRKAQSSLSDADEICVLYLSDMIHYNVESGNSNPDIGRFTFTAQSSLDKFHSQVKNSEIRSPIGLESITKLFPQSRLSVKVKKLAVIRDRSGYEIVKYMDLDKVWYDYFKMLGADSINMNLLH